MFAQRNFTRRPGFQESPAKKPRYYVHLTFLAGGDDAAAGGDEAAANGEDAGVDDAEGGDNPAAGGDGGQYGHGKN